MRFKIDENLPLEIAESLHRAGHDALMVTEQGLGGVADERVGAVCQNEDRILVTLDLDFANIYAYPPRDYPAIMVIRVRRQDKLHVLAVFLQVMPLLEIEQIEQRLWIMGKTGIRLRGTA